MSEPSDNGTEGHRVVVDVMVYALARFLLVAALSAAIYGLARLIGVTQFPIVVAVLFAFIIGMPMGIWLFSPLRHRATAARGTRKAAGPASRRDGARAGARRRVKARAQPLGMRTTCAA